MTGKKILVVDDDSALRLGLSVRLQANGYAVMFAPDGASALTAAQRERPDLILLELGLPAGDGFVVLERLKAIPGLATIPVIVLTARDPAESREKALGLGAEVFFQKPADNDALLLAIDRALGGRAPAILVVEDNPITRKMFRVTLAAEGFTVLEAPDGRTALELMARTAPDLVLQDLLLPDMDGFDLVSQLRALPGGEAIPILACSGFLSRFEATRMTALGFTDFLIKPVEPSRLIRTIHSLLPGHRGPGKGPGQDRHVLVVDDDPVQLKLARLHLSRIGFRVTTAVDGAEALAHARRTPPDAIVSDILMPRLDGFQLCLAVRQDPELARVPVVLTSANYLEEADRNLARKVGASGLTVRTADFGETIDLLVASLKEKPPRPHGPVEALEEEHLHRMIRQLERQVANNAALVQRSSFQAAVLSMLARLSTSLSERLEVEVAPDEVLEGLLDVGGLSVGALYLLGAGGRLELQAQHGYSGDDEAAASLFGHAELLDEAFRAEGPLAIPSAAIPPPTADDFLVRARVKSALLVPIGSRGEPMGLLFFGSKLRDLGDSDWRPFAQTVGGQISQAVALSRAFARLTAAEEKYRAIFENAVEGIFQATPDGRPLLVNPALARILGYGSPGKLIGAVSDVVTRLCPQPDGAAELRRVVAERSAVSGFDVRSAREDGSPIWLSVSARVTGHGQAAHLEGRVEDVTARRQLEDTLRESEEQFRRAFEDTAVGMALQAPEGRYLRVNRALCEMLGYSEDELRALTYQETEHPDDRGRDVAQDREMLAGERGWYQREKRYLHKRGHAVWVLATVSLVRAPDGRPLHFLVHAQDITGRKRTEDALRQSEKLAVMGELLAGVAHELNNPLGVLMGHAHLLHEAAGVGPFGARAVKIAQAADRCGRIVRNFLAIARQHPPERSAVALNQVVQEAVELLAYPLRVDGVDVRLELAQSLPPLRADPHQLHQVVVNLLSNAHHALREAPPPRRLTLTTRVDPASSRVTLEVADTGPGIPPEVQARVFEPFFTTKPLGQGTGLGLSLCQGIIGAHGGTIRVESAPGQGAVFRIELPVAVQAVAEATTPDSGAPPVVRGKTILVVDDEREMVGILAELLAAEGHRVETAENGAVALEMLRQGTYDLILTDMRMPELDGPGLYREVERRNPDLARWFIFLTGDGLSERTREFIEGTGLPRVSKPFDLEEVRRVLRQTLGRQTRSA